MPSTSPPPTPGWVAKPGSKHRGPSPNLGHSRPNLGNVQLQVPATLRCDPSAGGVGS
jgi:hypothetical protein